MPDTHHKKGKPDKPVNPPEKMKARMRREGLEMRARANGRAGQTGRHCRGSSRRF